MNVVPRTLEDEVTAAFDSVAVRYPYEQKPAVGPVTLSIRRGERVLLLGPSGCGKSTLLLALTGLIPKSIAGEVTGGIRIAGEPVASRQPAEWAERVAHFFQDADQTLTGMRVKDEIAFALENRALPEAEIEARVDAAMRLVGLPDAWGARPTMTLSGGEKQLVALAATLAQDAGLFVADEPTAHLAPKAASRLHRLLMEDRDRAVLIVDHRLDGLVGSVDRVVVLGKGGRILAEGPPRGFFRARYAMLQERGIWSPLASQLDAELVEAGAAPEIPPLTMDELFSHLDPESADSRLLAKARPVVADFVERWLPSSRAKCVGPVVASLQNAACAPFLGPVVLRYVSVELHSGEVLGILGCNGAGKTTLAACLAGILRPKAGRRTGPPGGVAFQKPEMQFTEGSVLDEVTSVLSAGRRRQAAVGTAREILAWWGLSALAHRHPYELSQGEKRRLALATLTATLRWPFLVLDEPVAGLDARGAAEVEADIARLRAAGCAVAVVTHDMDFALKLCPRSILVGEGGVLFDGPTPDLMRNTALLARAGLQPSAVMPALRWLERASRC